MHESTLTLGLPHTNRWGLAEHCLMKHAGHLHWAAIASTIGIPLSYLRTSAGGEVYATFYFVEEVFPASVPIDSFQLDHTLRFRLAQRAFKGIAIEGQLIFDSIDRLPELSVDPSPMAPSAGRGRHPYVRFGNILITPETGNRDLRVAAPANCDFRRFPVLPNDDNPYQLTRAAQTSGELGLLDGTWERIGDPEGFESPYDIDPERDTNGAGLVYFAEYFSFLEAAERAAARVCAAPLVQKADGRLVHERRTAFYGNVDVNGRLLTRVFFFRSPDWPSSIGVRYFMRRDGDGMTICLSEAVKRCVHA